MKGQALAARAFREIKCRWGDCQVHRKTGMSTTEQQVTQPTKLPSEFSGQQPPQGPFEEQLQRHLQYTRVPTCVPTATLTLRGTHTRRADPKPVASGILELPHR